MLHILLVDDERIVADVLKQILVRLGHRVDTASTGREGILKFRRQPYDLVITDMVMADMEGRSVVEYVRRSDRPFTPVVGISGTPWLLPGLTCNAVLAKPFTIDALKDAIDRALGTPVPPFEVHRQPALSMG